MKRLPTSQVPILTTSQMIEVDRLMIEEWHISLLQMMENAGRNLADLTCFLLGGSVKGKQIVVLSGKGNNGGGGMVAARHLHNWGACVKVRLMGSPDELKPIPAKQWMTIQKMGLTETDLQLSKANFIIDAMIGYGLQGKPRPPVSGWITKANQSRSPILALDAPTGLDATTGKPATYCIKAKATMTLAMPKMGLLTNAAQPYVGDLYLADIGVPPELYQSPTLSLNIENNPHYFDKGCIIKLY